MTLTLFATGDVPANQAPSLGAGVCAATGERTFAVSFVVPLYDLKGDGAGQGRVHATFAVSEAGAEASGRVRVTILDPDRTEQERSPVTATCSVWSR